MSHKIKVLCIDDEPILLDILEFMLEDLDVICRKVLDAKQAIELIACESFNLIISDVNMPGMSGIELFKFLKYKNIKTPFAFSTGGVAFQDDNEEFREIKKDIFAYLEKPYDEKALALVVKKIQEKII